MPRWLPLRSLAWWMIALAAALPAFAAPAKHEKTIWNYDGGVFLETDGAIPGGACFRVKGRLEAPDFFQNLRREDTGTGTVFRRGNDVVTDFPRQLELTLTIFDAPCDPLLKQTSSRIYLTDEMIRTLRLSFYWKHQLEMRPARGIVERDVAVDRIPPIFGGLADPAPQRYEWHVKFDVPGDGVPLTDSLVLVLRTPDHRIAARTAARL